VVPYTSRRSGLAFKKIISNIRVLKESSKKSM